MACVVDLDGNQAGARGGASFLREVLQRTVCDGL